MATIGDNRMKARPSIVVLSGEPDSGKTTICARVVALARARGLEVAGVLTPPRLAGGCKVGLDVEEIRTGQRRPLAEGIGPTDGPATECWRFHPDGLAWGTEILCLATPCDLLVIDELGPLELVRNQGWTIGFDLLRASRYRLALVVVRTALLSRFRGRLGGVEPLILAVTVTNRDALPGEIVALLEPYLAQMPSAFRKARKR